MNTQKQLIAFQNVSVLTTTNRNSLKLKTSNVKFVHIIKQESPLPPTDPRDAVAQLMLNISIASYGNWTIPSTRPSCWRSRQRVWSTVVRRPSEVYDTHPRTKLTCSAWDDQPLQRYGWCPQKFKWFTWPNHALSGMVCHPRASTCYTVNLPTKFEISNSTHYEYIKDDKNVKNGVVWR